MTKDEEIMKYIKELLKLITQLYWLFGIVLIGMIIFFNVLVWGK